MNADTSAPVGAITPTEYREVFGLLPTGVVAITGLTDEGKPMGFVVGTFQSLSLDPPLVTFCVDKSSSTWPTLRSLGRFTANILSTQQLDVCRALARKGEDKFQGIEYAESPIGTPRILNSTAWIDCHVASEVVAGDHYMIVGSVTAMESGAGDALMFRGGKFGEYSLWPTDTHPESRKPMNMLTRIVDAWSRAWGEGDTGAFESIVGKGYVRHSKTGEEGLPEVIRQIQESHAAFSDFKVHVLQAVEDSEHIAIHWKSVGTHTGNYMGVPPTQRTVTVNGASFLRHKDGLIIEESVVWDPRELLSSMNIWHLGDQVRRNA
ncbi:flavin reductase [Arthrobacter sp. ISL-30]|uniref:flavin reductase n=1 Tax=Arthrobacter sp. ISL-30 TaxID=2819109 RepID=UPI001BEB2F2B|nr:flavin reductase [Arthrobacter sp. ISL-30]MBT2515684.1 flavin reductase [Arthrobacter sp. ISL-30]